VEDAWEAVAWEPVAWEPVEADVLVLASVVCVEVADAVGAVAEAPVLADAASLPAVMVTGSQAEL
jgi:hypothetical protein